MRIKQALAFFENLKQGNSKFSRLIKPFSTKDNFYVYDTGTGKVLKCEQKEYDFLTVLYETNDVLLALKTMSVDSYFDKTISDLISVIKQENLLQAPPVVFNAEVDSLIELANESLEQITLELTEQCNMACRYCIYDSMNDDFRGFGKNRMTWETARDATQYALSHSGNQIAVTFYGGEPLLEFENMRKCIDYAFQHKRDKNISFSLTTNLTLVTPPIAQYLASVPNLSVVCSVDGPEEIHDKNRIFLNGDGTFSYAINGLKLLVEAFGEKSKSVLSLSMVIANPVDSAKVEEISNFFKKLTWLPPEMTKNLSYQRIPLHKIQLHKERPTRMETNNPLSAWSIKQILDSDINVNELFTSHFVSQYLSSIQNRYLADKPYCNYQLNGCCKPASRKIYVTTSGDFYLCERMGESPSIGNVRDGLNIEKLRQHYISDYINGSIPSCVDCWAIRLCPLCYCECYNNHSFQSEKKAIACARTKVMLEDQLFYYHTIMENNPGILKSVSRMA